MRGGDRPVCHRSQNFKSVAVINLTAIPHLQPLSYITNILPQDLARQMNLRHEAPALKLLIRNRCGRNGLIAISIPQTQHRGSLRFLVLWWSRSVLFGLGFGLVGVLLLLLQFRSSRGIGCGCCTAGGAGARSDQQPILARILCQVL